MATFTTLPPDVQRVIGQLLPVGDVDNLRRIGRFPYRNLTPIFYEKLPPHWNIFPNEIERQKVFASSLPSNIARFPANLFSYLEEFVYYKSDNDGNYLNYFFTPTINQEDINVIISYSHKPMGEIFELSFFLQYYTGLDPERYDLYFQYLLARSTDPPERNYSRRKILNILNNYYTQYQNLPLDENYLYYFIRFHIYLSLNSYIFSLQLPLSISMPLQEQIDTIPLENLENYKREIEYLYSLLVQKINELQ